MVPEIRPEVSLLVNCARVHMDEQHAQHIKALAARKIDWNYLLEVAGPHAMKPLLYRHLNELCADAIPESVLSGLQEFYKTNSFRNMALSRELLSLLDLFESHGVVAIPYKGPVLTESVYGNLSLRQFCDLDILVGRQDVLKAKDLLMDRGYRPEFQLTPAQEITFLKSQCEYNFHRQDVVLEAHWEIVERFFCFSMDFDSLRQRLTPVALGGREVMTLSAEDLLLIVCVHSAKHLWERLQWICDVAEVIRIYPRMAWDSLIERARSLGAQRMLFLGLALARDVLEITLPDDILKQVLTDSSVLKLAHLIKNTLLSKEGHLQRVVTKPLFRPLYLKMWERRRDRFRYCYRVLTTPTMEDLGFVSLPAALLPLYYLLRPLRLTGKYASRVIHHLAGPTIE